MADDPAMHGATAVPTTLVAASVISIAASACISTLLSFYATFAVSLVCFARALSTERVDGVLDPLDAYLRQKVLLARAAVALGYADLKTDLRRLGGAARSHPATAPVYARAEERGRTVAGWADGLRRRAEATWSQHKEAAGMAWFLLRAIARAIRLAATVLINAAYKEARARAPSVLRYCRGVIKEVRSPRPYKKAEEAAASSGFWFKDMACLVVIVSYILFTTYLLVDIITAGGLQFCALFFATMCPWALLVSEGLHLRVDSDEAGAATDRLYTANDSRRVSNGDEARREAELQVRESWKQLWLLIIIAYFVDACLLRVTLGPGPVELAFLALCHFEVLNIGRQVHLTPDDREGARGTGAGENGGVDKWRSAAMAMWAASSAKVFVIYLVLDVHLAALSFASLCILTAILLIKEESLSDLDASGNGEDGEEGAGFAGDITGGAEEEAGEVRAEHYSNTGPEDAEGGSALEEHCDSSEECIEEQRQEEPDYSSGGSMDDGWNIVEVDSEMPIKANRARQ